MFQVPGSSAELESCCNSQGVKSRPRGRHRQDACVVGGGCSSPPRSALGWCGSPSARSSTRSPKSSPSCLRPQCACTMYNVQCTMYNTVFELTPGVKEDTGYRHTGYRIQNTDFSGSYVLRHDLEYEGSIPQSTRTCAAWGLPRSSSYPTRSSRRRPMIF